MPWRFLPLKESDRFGILVDTKGEPKPARFLSLKEMQEEARESRIRRRCAWKRAA